MHKLFFYFFPFPSALFAVLPVVQTLVVRRPPSLALFTGTQLAALEADFRREKYP